MTVTNLKSQILYPYMFNFSDDIGANNQYELWNKGNVVTTYNNNPIYKTIYDPCPVTFSNVKPAAFTGFTTTGSNSTTYSQYNVVGSFNMGWTFYCQPNFMGSTIFFPALGYITRADRGLVDVNASCHYWSAGPYSTTNGSRPSFYTTGIYNTSSCNHSYAISIRPASEK